MKATEQYFRVVKVYYGLKGGSNLNLWMKS